MDENRRDTSMNDLKFAVLGAGAMGSVFGARLAMGGADVTLLDVNQGHLDAVNAQGLKMDLDNGAHRIDVPAMRPEDYTDTPDIVLLFTKVFHTDAALASISARLGDAVVFSLQNGIGNAERVAAHVPQDRIVLGMTLTPAEFVGPGRVASHGSATTQFGALQPAANIDLDAIKRALVAGGIDAKISPTIQTAIWEKAAFNCAMNALCALTNGTPGSIGANDVARQLASNVVQEVIDVATASGIPADGGSVEKLMSHAYAHHLMHEPSMLQDIKAGRRTEIGALNAAVAEAGHQLGISTPVNQTLAHLISLAETTPGFRAAQGSGAH